MFPGEGYQGNGSLSHIWKGETGGEGEKKEEEEEEEETKNTGVSNSTKVEFLHRHTFV